MLCGFIEGLSAPNQPFLGLAVQTWLWVALSVLTALCPAYTFIATAREDKAPNKFQIAAAPVAFIFWAFALGEPF